MLDIILLVIGILGFVKKRINVTKHRELRGGGMYAVATLFCLPLPLSFLIGVVIGAQHVASGTPVDHDAVLKFALLATWVPVLTAFVLAFTLAKPKVLAPQAPEMRGFDVKQ